MYVKTDVLWDVSEARAWLHHIHTDLAVDKAAHCVTVPTNLPSRAGELTPTNTVVGPRLCADKKPHRKQWSYCIWFMAPINLSISCWKFELLQSRARNILYGHTEWYYATRRHCYISVMVVNTGAPMSRAPLESSWSVAVNGLLVMLCCGKYSFHCFWL